jgi:hypothetical protein
LPARRFDLIPPAALKGIGLAPYDPMEKAGLRSICLPPGEGGTASAVTDEGRKQKVILMIFTIGEYILDIDVGKNKTF